jgi:L-methionine (R)-S-oxide reductase
MRADYPALAARIAALTEGETDTVALMATVACEVHHADDRFDWTGFYRVTAPGVLKIGPYQGGHGCLVIPFDRGVCGACARTRSVQLVPDVDAFPGHIACASSTRSELVLPVFDGSATLIGVLDLDSDQPAAFDQADADALTDILRDVFGGLAGAAGLEPATYGFGDRRSTS